MTIKKSTEFFHELHDKYEAKFEKAMPSFHNLLWQFIVNDIHPNKIIAFTPVHYKGGLQISTVNFNVSGHWPTNVHFAKGVSYDEALEICQDLNLQLFGMTDQLAFAIIATSMRQDLKEA
jgi:hypothetical protein